MKTPRKQILFILLLTLLHISTTEQWYQHGNPHFINEHDYQKLVINPQTRNKGVTLLKFFTPWCRYCKYLKDIIDDLKSKDTWSITMYEVNCDGQNHQFCAKMGVHSFPKMKVYDNGNLMDNMDGFYPYPVVRELFLKYNRTQAIPEVKAPLPEPKAQDKPKQTAKQQNNAIEPQAVPPLEQKKPDQPKQPEQKVNQLQKTQQKTQVSLHHAQQTNPAQPKPQEPQNPTPQKPKTQQAPKPQTQKPAQPQKTQSKPQVKTDENKPQSKKTQQMIEEEQNIAVVDQNLKETQTQKKIVEDLTKKTVDTIDLTKILPGEQHAQYGKYIIYAICIFVGGYYFVHIMKAEPVETAKPYRSNQGQSTQKTSKSQIPAKVSIQDSQLREQLHFEHPNEEQINFNSVQVRDEDL